jgi:hypothetical protein
MRRSFRLCLLFQLPDMPFLEADVALSGVRRPAAGFCSGANVKLSVYWFAVRLEAPNAL